MKKILSLFLAMCIILSVFLVSCDAPSTSTEVQSNTESKVESTASETETTASETETTASETETTASETETTASETETTESETETTESETETTESETETTESETETTESETETTESETETTESETELETFPNAAPVLPSSEPDFVYSCGDGATLEQYNDMTEKDFYSARSYYLADIFTEYSYNVVGNTLSTTLVWDEEYYVLFFNKNNGELYITHGSEGAELFPSNEPEEYEKLCETTVTQHYSDQINGMGYIFRLEDGSFIIIDGGYATDVEDLFATINDLKVTEDIHIRAWLITHSHTDHYEAFSTFAQTHASEVKLDHLLYAPINVNESNVTSYYSIQMKKDVLNFDGIKLNTLHTGMVLSFADVQLEVLLTPEHIFKEGPIADFNESSIVCRIKNSDGSFMILGDCGELASDWLVETYGDGLKSDMVQISHHGCETATAELYDHIAAPMVFWPCDESLFNSYRGELVKQHIIEAEYSIEHILHGYGTVTRDLSYVPETPEMLDLFPLSSSLVVTLNDHVENIRIEDGVLKYEVFDTGDPYISINLKKVSTGNCNMLRLVVDSDAAVKGNIFISSGSDSLHSYTRDKLLNIKSQGKSTDGTTTYIVYLGNLKNFDGDIKSIRLDFGQEEGQTVEIYSLEAYYVDMN